VKSFFPFRDLYRTFVFFGALFATVTGVAKAPNDLRSPILEDAVFNGQPIDPVVASSPIQQANQLLQQVPQ
jgi:hypothetical protein